MENKIDFLLPKEIEEAFLLMEEKMPKYPFELMERLGAYQGRDWLKQKRPHFREWIGTVDGMTRYSAEFGGCPKDLSKIGYIGVWVGRSQSDQTIAWCSIPSMSHGKALPGQSLEIGEERFLPSQSQDEIDAMVVKGWEVMQDLIGHSEKNEA